MPHSIEIYRGDNILLSVKPGDNSIQNKTVMGDNSITLDFELRFEVKFMVNDWCTVFGERYVIAENPPPVTKESKLKFKYTLTMKSQVAELQKIQYFFLDDNNRITNPDFSLTGNAQTFIDLLIRNTDRFLTDQQNFGPSWIDLTPWTAAEVIQTDYKTLTFSSDDCLSALSKIADAFGTEWWVIGKKIFLAKLVNDTGITLKHGRQKGLYEITRQPADSSKIVTAVFPYGSTKNIPSDYGSDRLRCRVFPSNRFSRNEDFYGVIEQIVIFEDIYPNRTGKVTAVDAANVYKFTDSTIDFNLLDNLLPGMPAKVAFNTGQLSGWKFEVGAYDDATKTITLLKNRDETTIDVPSASLKPSIGDEYVFVDIKLPDAYVTDAENRLYSAASAYLIENSDPKFKFSIVLDPVFVKNRGYEFSIGDLVWITDNDLEIDRKIRVVQTSRKIVEENQYTLTLSDTVSSGTIQSIQKSISTTQADVNQIGTQLQSGALFNGRMVIPETTDVTGMSPLYIDNATDKIYKKV